MGHPGNVGQTDRVPGPGNHQCSCGNNMEDARAESQNTGRKSVAQAGVR